jgi:hypothetical protein
MKTDRTQDGRFAVGNCGGPGRPPRHVETEYLAVTLAACSVQDWREIISKAVQAAKGGDDKARLFLASYILGTPKAPARLWTGAMREQEREADFPYL